jgi:hypothetical protein
MLFSCKPVTNIINEGEGWVLLGEEKVNHIRERDVISIRTQDTFTALRLYVKERKVTIQSMKIYLINGDILQPSLEKSISSNERSRIVEIAADGRQLDRIELRYRSEGSIFTKRGVIQLLGRRYNPNGRY